MILYTRISVYGLLVLDVGVRRQLGPDLDPLDREEAAALPGAHDHHDDHLPGCHEPDPGGDRGEGGGGKGAGPGKEDEAAA